MTIPLYAYDQSFEGHISARTVLKWEREGVAQLIREKPGRNKGAIRRAVMRRRPGDPLPERTGGRPTREQLEREQDEAWEWLRQAGYDRGTFFPEDDSWLDDFRPGDTEE